MKKTNCSGCEDNFYNNNNPYNVKECFRFKDAKLVKRRKVPLSQPPPWKQPLETVPECYKQKGYCFLKKDFR